MKSRIKMPIAFLSIVSLMATFSLASLAQTINVKKFGAKGDGRTDDTKAIQAAIDAAGNSMRTVYFPNGTYVIGSYVKTSNYLENYCLKLHSGITIKGEGNKSIIKLKDHIFDKNDTMANAHIFYGTFINHLVFTALTIDLNGGKNLVPKNVLKNNMAIFIDNGSDVSVSGLVIKNCSGTNMVMLKGEGHGLLIEKSFFYNGGNYIGIPIPNHNQIDFSFIYSEWDSTLITNNRIEQQNIDIALRNYTGGIELHGSNSCASNNVIIGCNPGLFITSSQHPIEKITVINNKIEKSLRGISFWIYYSINQISISNNAIDLTFSRGQTKSFITGIEMPNGNALEYNFKSANAAPVFNLAITGNTITAVLNDNTKDRTIGLLLHSLQNSIIEGNEIAGMNYGGIVIMGSKWGMKSVRFLKNNFFDFKTNNDLKAVAGYIVINDAYSGKNSAGIKDILFKENKFGKGGVIKTLRKKKINKGQFYDVFIAMPQNNLKEVLLKDNQSFGKIVSVKTD